LGTTNHLVTEQFKHLTKVDLLHVPYKGGAPAMADIVSGHISMLFSLAADSLSQIKAGKVRALATSASKRLSVLPDVPTLAELGIHGIEMQHWYGVVTPAKTPADIVTRLRAEVSTVLKGPEFTRWLESQGSSPVAGTSEVLTNRIRADMAQAEKIAKSISLKLDD
jgi:tripartite-type tricarboxylate transporter receptor subunit TctC